MSSFTIHYKGRRIDLGSPLLKPEPINPNTPKLKNHILEQKYIKKQFQQKRIVKEEIGITKFNDMLQNTTQNNSNRRIITSLSSSNSNINNKGNHLKINQDKIEFNNNNRINKNIITDQKIQESTGVLYKPKINQYYNGLTIKTLKQYQQILLMGTVPGKITKTVRMYNGGKFDVSINKKRKQDNLGYRKKNQMHTLSSQRSKQLNKKRQSGGFQINDFKQKVKQIKFCQTTNLQQPLNRYGYGNANKNIQIDCTKDKMTNKKISSTTFLFDLTIRKCPNYQFSGSQVGLRLENGLNEVEYLSKKKKDISRSLTKKLLHRNSQPQNQQIHKRPYRLISVIHYNHNGFLQTTPQQDYQHKLSRYLQFLFLISLSNRIFRIRLDGKWNLQSKPPQQRELIQYNFIVERGNNGDLIKRAFKKRFWWKDWNQNLKKGITNKSVNLIWSPHKKSNVFKIQQIYAQNIFKQQTKLAQFPISTSMKSGTNNSNFNSKAQFQQLKIVRKIMSAQQWQFLRFTLNGEKYNYFEKCKGLINNGYIKLQQLDQGQTKIIITNHLPSHDVLSNKKSLFLALRLYYLKIKKQKIQKLWEILPQTYHIRNLTQKSFQQFQQSFKKNKNKIWIIKPGQFTNRGNGIKLSDKLEDIKNIISYEEAKPFNSYTPNLLHTFIIQKYINDPFLYQKRKFDIRTYLLITIDNKIIKGYWYGEGYIRTSSSYYQAGQLSDTYMHLTNDAIQKFSDNYGKFQLGNKLSYGQFQRYLENWQGNNNNNTKLNFQRDIHPKLKSIAIECLFATYKVLDANKQRNNNFQIFGLDFMLDSNFNPYLLQINTNPCLETGCPTLERIIPGMIQNAIRIAVDPIFPPPPISNSNKYIRIQQQQNGIAANAIQHNNFELIFDQIRDSEKINGKFENQSQRLEYEALLQTIRKQAEQIIFSEKNKQQLYFQKQNNETKYYQSNGNEGRQCMKIRQSYFSQKNRKIDNNQLQQRQDQK